MSKWYITNGILHCDDYFPADDITNGAIRYLHDEETVPVGSRPFEFDRNSTALTIPSDVYAIAPLTFSFCNKLEEVTFGDGLEFIDFGAFYGHKKIRRLTFPETLHSIEALAFSAEIRSEHRNVFSLLKTKYAADSDMPCIPCTEGSALTDDTMLESISFEGDVFIEDGAFFGCHRLSFTSVAEHFYTCGKSAFAPFNLLDVFEDHDHLLSHFPEKVAFADRKWYITEGVLHCDAFILPIESSVPFDFSAESTSLVIPEGVSVIAERAFRGCKNLRKLTVPGSVKCICEAAFSACHNLDKVTLGEGIRRLCPYSFIGCRALKEITLPAGEPLVERSVFAGCSALERVTLISGCNRVNRLAIGLCENLREIILPVGAALPDPMFFGCEDVLFIHAD